MADLAGELSDRLRAKDALLFSLSDTLDVKASIALVLITFLATQSESLLAKVASAGLLHRVQIVSAVALAIAGGLAFIALWPRAHDTETAEGLAGWIDELREHYKHDSDPEVAVTNAFRAGLLTRLKKRIAVNSRIVDTKSHYVTWSFRCAALALALNMATLLVLTRS